MMICGYFWWWYSSDTPPETYTNEAYVPASVTDGDKNTKNRCEVVLLSTGINIFMVITIEAGY